MGTNISVDTILSMMLAALLCRFSCTITCKVTKKTDNIPLLVKTFILYEQFLMRESACYTKLCYFRKINKRQ